MLVIGLTGSIGMGKSTVAGRFRDLGIAVCDADAIVHELYSGAAIAPVSAAFPGVLTDGKIDRAKLGASLIKDPSGFKRLEAIVHPLVRAAERECLLASARRGGKIAVLEIPLLFETGGDRFVDVTIVVSAPSAIRRDRVLARPGMTEIKLAEILSRQMPDEEKRRRAHFVVDTSGSIAESWAQLDKILQSLMDRAGANRDRLAFAQHWQQ
jgi:dephospho-CoA kinase